MNPSKTDEVIAVSDAMYIAVLMGFLFALGLIRVIVEDVLHSDDNSPGRLIDQAVGLLVLCALVSPFAYLGYVILSRLPAVFAG